MGEEDIMYMYIYLRYTHGIMHMHVYKTQKHNKPRVRSSYLKGDGEDGGDLLACVRSVSHQLAGYVRVVQNTFAAEQHARRTFCAICNLHFCSTQTSMPMPEKQSERARSPAPL